MDDIEFRQRYPGEAFSREPAGVILLGWEVGAGSRVGSIKGATTRVIVRE
jgi:hypothetical protein